MGHKDDLHGEEPKGFAFKIPEAPAPIMTDSGDLVPEDLGTIASTVPAGGSVFSPFWTSSLTTSGAIATATGISPTYVAATLPYTDSLYAHLERAKEECLRSRIEADTVVIDRGVAVSQGLGHAKMVLGLKVRYSNEGSLPMGAAFVMLKAKADAGPEPEPTPEEDEAWKEKEEKEAGAEKKEGIVKRTLPVYAGTHRLFIDYTTEVGGCALVNIDHVVDAQDEYMTCGGKEVWAALALTMDAVGHSGSGSRIIRIKDPEEAKAAWTALLDASRFKS